MNRDSFLGVLIANLIENLKTGKTLVNSGRATFKSATPRKNLDFAANDARNVTETRCRERKAFEAPRRGEKKKTVMKFVQKSLKTVEF